VFFSIALSREVIRKMEINREIAELETEIALLETDNGELSNLIEYFNSTSWQEKEARSKLNLRKEGEGVIAILDNGNLAIVNEDGEVVETNNEQQVSQLGQANPSKWFEYFFN